MAGLEAYARSFIDEMEVSGALAIMDDLVDRGVKALVIACNSASAACLRDARERYDVPVLEVILPAVRRAVAATRNGRIGVIGTAATVSSGAYQDAFAAAGHPGFQRRGDRQGSAAGADRGGSAAPARRARGRPALRGHR